MHILFIIALVLVAGCAQAPPAALPPDQPLAAVKEFTLTASNFTFAPEVITVSKGDRVRLKITALDTPHGIAIPAFGIDQALPVGQQETIEFTADKTGTFDFKCNVPCGPGHMEMTGKIVVQ